MAIPVPGISMQGIAPTPTFRLRSRLRRAVTTMGCMEAANKKFLTLRTIFDRATVLGLRSEPDLRNSVELLAEESVQPTNDAYLAILTLVAESTEEGTLKLRIVSTTVLGIQRYSIKRLNSQNVFVHGGAEGLFMELLRCHYRHRQRKLDEVFM